ncbi:MAG: oleate hydratase [Acidobacteriaceae bacterium]|nr:oleate hydratase [Acidobacteriaceae bacterium]
MSEYYFVGSGIASLAGAAYLIRDGNVSGADIVIFEESKEFGGSIDAHGSPKDGYFMSGSRMFEHKYNATFDLFSFIPSASDPNLSVKEETALAEKDALWHNKARLVNGEGKIINFHELGFSEKDRIDLIALMATPEKMLDSKRITDCFGADFFNTNFWFEWCSLFAFERWHSAIEFKRYLLRFIHHFSTIDTQEGIFRTRYNQYDSMAVPLVNWLRGKGVEFRMQTQVTNLGFKAAGTDITVNSLQYNTAGTESELPVADGDLVFVTNGSMTADKTFGSMTEAPKMDRSKRSGAWRLWETIAAGRPEFGNPTVFDSHIEESSWESFTVTMNDPTFFQLMQQFSGSEAGKGGLITFKDSNWLLTLSIFHQPFYADQPKDVVVWWGYGLYHDRPGNFVKKTMAECTGREILEEVIGQLRFDEHKEKMLATSNVIPCMMPYITSQFLVRKAGDRPDVVPKGSTNLAFLGQYSELPDDVVFTVEYSVRSAQIAVYSLLKLDKKPSPFYKGQYDPRVLFDALKTLHR